MRHGHRRASLIAASAPIRALTLSIAVALATYPGSDALAQQVVTLTGDPWPPYAEGTLGSEASGGIAVELVREIFNQIDGTQASFPLIPWKRALREVAKGTMDGIVILLKTAERDRYMAFSDPLFEAIAGVW